MADTKDLTISEKLTDLYNLQLIDSQIDEIAILRGELPIEVKDLEDEIEGLNTRINNMGDAVKELEDTNLKHNTNIKDAEALITKYEKQLDDVKNNREYDALQKEIELQKLEIQLSNKRIKELGSKTELKKGTFEEAKEKLKVKDKELETKKVELEKILEKTNKQEAKLVKESTKAKKKIEERLLKAYDKVRTAYRNGLAVVTVERNSCGGCYNKIPPQLQLEISQRKKIIACEHCGRILVDDKLLETPEGVES